MFLLQLMFVFTILLFVLCPLFGQLVDGYSSYRCNLLSGATMIIKAVAFIVLASVFFWAVNGVLEGVLLW